MGFILPFKEQVAVIKDAHKKGCGLCMGQSGLFLLFPAARIRTGPELSGTEAFRKKYGVCGQGGERIRIPRGQPGFLWNELVFFPKVSGNPGQVQQGACKLQKFRNRVC